MKNIQYDTRNFYGQARILDGRYEITGEALLLACLLHTHGDELKDLGDVQRIMNDVNYED